VDGRGQQKPPSLAKARTLYNAANYEGAIDAAAVARRQPPWTDAAALVMARSYLERFRQNADAKDLVSAREAFVAIKASALTPRDQVDLVIGLGQMMYLGELFGAAADLFQTALFRSTLLGPRDKQMLLDWWATAMDRDAQTRPVDRRRTVFEQISERMQEELQQDPGNAVANYWRAVALRGMGDIEGAWHAAIAAWVRSTLSPETTGELRADLDRLVTQALIPERSRVMSVRDPQEAVTALRAEWDLVKEQWK